MTMDRDLLLAMGLQREDFVCVDQAPTREEQLARFAELKEKIRKGYRKLSFELHPDRGGSVDQLQRLNALKAELDAISVPVWIEPSSPRQASTARTHARSSRPMSPEQVAAVAGLRPGVIRPRDRF